MHMLDENRLFFHRNFGTITSDATRGANMTKVKGIYKGNTVQLLEPVSATNGVEVDVIFNEPGAKDQSFVTAMKQEMARMEKGLKLGGGPYYRSRDELHER